MRKLAFTFGLALLSTFPVFAQRLDRASFRPSPAAPHARVVELALEEQKPDFFFVQVAGVDKSGDVSPNAQLALVHNEDQHPWYIVSGYSHAVGTGIEHRDTMSASANYQFWTGAKSKILDAPYVQIEGDYVNTLSSAQSWSAVLDGGLSRGDGDVTLDVLASWATEKDRGAARVSDFIPSLTAEYKVIDGLRLTADYEFKNDVDGPASYDAGLKKSLPGKFLLIAVVGQHHKYTLRLRKSFNGFNLRGGRMH